jgi:hypothetical protein
MADRLPTLLATGKYYEYEQLVKTLFYKYLLHIFIFDLLDLK